MKRKRKQAVVGVVLILLFPVVLLAQQTADEGEEVYLTFRYQNLFNVYVTAYYLDDRFYLPHYELFRLLEIHAVPDLAQQRVHGRFPELGDYEINYRTGIAHIAADRFELRAEDHLVSDMDYYLRAELFYELFGLDFEINFSNLSLRLESEHTMPIVTRQERERRRQRALRTERSIVYDYYPLEFNRNRQIFNAGFLDYNLTANLSQDVNSYLFNTSIGSELIGGDLQGSIFGNWSRTSSSLRSSNLRWQYGFHDSEWVTRLTVGQTSSRGLTPTAYTGVRVTNEPIEPRFLYDDYLFSGRTLPDSEVELYRNNVLIDYQTADDSGEYRFQIPLTYGATQYSMRIFTPTGEMMERSTRIQIPFTFLPPGEFNYSVEGGRLDNPIIGTTERGFMGKGNFGYGLNNWLTATGGVEYFDTFHEDGLPTFTAGLSSRIFTSYLLRLEAASDAFYRASASVMYGSGASINLSYTDFITQSRVYNPAGNLSRVQADLFLPFLLADIPFFFRSSISNEQRNASDVTRYNFNLNARFGRLSLRTGFRDSQVGALSLRATPTSRIIASVRYSLPRRGELPRWLLGTFIRSRVSYSPAISRWEDFELQGNRSLLGDGSIQIAAGRNFVGGFNYLRLNLSLNFNSFRATTTGRVAQGGNPVASQSIRGSIGYDSGNDRFMTSNRQQVGRAGMVVRLFEDRNNSGTLDDGDQLLDESAVRVERSGGRILNREGLNYVSQLQPYRRYNVVINKAAISNPLLVPRHERFSVITDPNQYKVIDIPLYMSGVIDGQVVRLQDGTESPLSGLRLYLSSMERLDGEEPFHQELRTFSDGSFYAFEIPPGSYRLEIDPTQLEFLNAGAEPETIDFEVRPLAEGDFVSGLDFRVIPIIDPEELIEEIVEVPLTNVRVDRDVEHHAREDVESITFHPDGPYTVQVWASNSHRRAEEVASFWRRKGFEHTYVSVFKDDPAGEVRFRVRIGNVPNYTIAERLEEIIVRGFQTDVWITSTSEWDKPIVFDPDGPYTIQVWSSNSENRANEVASFWRRKGFEHTYVIVFEDESADALLYRVRLGNVSSYTMAQRLRGKVIHVYQSDGWITTTNR